jgi:hypothetical protein
MTQARRLLDHTCSSGICSNKERRICGKTLILSFLLLLLASPSGFSRSLDRKNNSPTEKPADLQGIKVYHLPEKASGNLQGLAVVRSVAYREINLDRLALTVLMRMNAVDRPITVQKIYFQDLRANGIPVHIESYEGEFRLSKKEAVDLPAPLELSLVFAELESLEPVRRLVSQDVVHITGQIYIVCQLTTLEALVMRSRQVVVPVSLDQQVPMHMFAGEPMMQAAVLKLLDTLSSPYSMAAAALARQRQDRMSARRTLAAAAEGRLFLVYCGYSLRNSKTKDEEHFVQSGTGFLIQEGMLLTAKRVVQPWKFDAQAAYLMSHAGFELEPKAYRLVAWPAGATVTTAAGELEMRGALSTDQHTLQVWKVPPDVMETRPYDSGAGVQADVSIHTDGANDVALLKIAKQAPAATPLLATAGEGLSSATLLGFPFGASKEQARLEQVKVDLGASDSTPSGLVLLTRRALGPGEAGAPLLTPEGKVMAVCGGPRTCVPIATALPALEGVSGLPAPAGSNTKKEPPLRFEAQRRELFVINLEEVHQSLGLAKHDLPADGVWQRVNPGGTFYTSDDARLHLRTARKERPEETQVTWYQRIPSDPAWQVLGHGAELAFHAPASPGLMLIRAEAVNGGNRLFSEAVQYEIKRRHCAQLYTTVLEDVALAVATFREAKATTRTYKEAWASDSKLPRQITMLPDPEDPRQQPYQLAEGDVVLRTGGPLGYVQRALGQPQSPQNHSGVISIEHYGDTSIHMVNEIGWGYEYTPLTPADAVAYQKMKSLPEMPESFMEGANVGTLEVYRPMGVVQRSRDGKTSWEPYPIGRVAAARAREIGAAATLGYDFLFLESSSAADQWPFKGLYYCHKFTREAFGRKLANPGPIPILWGLWQAVRACDRETASLGPEERGSAPAALAAVLAEIDIDHCDFSPDPARNEAMRQDFRELIGALRRFLNGESFEHILTTKVAEKLKDGTASGLLNALLRGNSPVGTGGPNLPQDMNNALQQLLNTASITDLAKSSGNPEAYAPLLGAAFFPGIQGWLAANRMGLARLITEELVEDLGNAIDAKSLLAGGEAMGKDGEIVRVTFKRISASMP